jgi:hypothetical protein
MTCVGGTGIELVASSVSGQVARVVVCAQLDVEQGEWSAQVRGCPAACPAIVTQLVTRGPSVAARLLRPEASYHAICHGPGRI